MSEFTTPVQEEKIDCCCFSYYTKVFSLVSRFQASHFCGVTLMILFNNSIVHAIQLPEQSELSLSLQNGKPIKPLVHGLGTFWLTFV